MPGAEKTEQEQDRLQEQTAFKNTSRDRLCTAWPYLTENNPKGENVHGLIIALPCRRQHRRPRELALPGTGNLPGTHSIPAQALISRRQISALGRDSQASEGSKVLSAAVLSMKVASFSFSSTPVRMEGRLDCPAHRYTQGMFCRAKPSSPLGWARWKKGASMPTRGS